MKRLILTLFILLLTSTAYAQLYVVERVIEGDTFKLTNGEKVRLIGVNTPATDHPRKKIEYLGKAALAFTKKLCEGKMVKLELDWEDRDQHDRLLAYAYLEDGTFVNAEIVKQGYGYAYTQFPFKYSKEFRRYEREAREDRRGLWSVARKTGGIITNVLATNVPGTHKRDGGMNVQDTNVQAANVPGVHKRDRFVGE